MNGVDLDGTCLSAAAPQTPARPLSFGCASRVAADRAG